MTFWTIDHVKTVLPFIFISFLLTYVIAFFLRDKKESIKIIPIRIVIVLLDVLEIIKLIYLAVNKTITLFSIPLHLSSLFVFIGPIYCLYTYKRENRFAKAINSTFYAYTLVEAILITLNPNIVYSSSSINTFFTSFNSFHSIFYHDSMYVICFLLVMLKMVKSDVKKDLINVAICMVPFFVFEAIMANILKTNYNNMYYCSIDFIDAVRVKWTNFSPFFGQLLYVVIMICVNMIVLLLGCFLNKYLTKLVDIISNLDDKWMNKVKIKLHLVNKEKISVNINQEDNDKLKLNESEKKFSIILHIVCLIVALSITVPVMSTVMYNENKIESITLNL